MDILTQLNKAMAYIEDHIDDDLALAKVSGVTAYYLFTSGVCSITSPICRFQSTSENVNYR